MGNNWAGAFLSAMMSFGPIGLFHESMIQKQFYEKLPQREQIRVIELQHETFHPRDLIVWKNGNVFMVTMESRSFSPWVATSVTSGSHQVIIGSTKKFAEIKRIIRYKKELKDPEYDEYFDIFSNQE